MTLTKLSLSLALLFSIGLGRASDTNPEIIAKQIQDARSITNSWILKRSEGLRKKDIFEGQAERADYIISGIPKFVKEVNSKGVVYRHYTGSHTAIILETKQLKTGITPYIIMNPGYSREVYEDLVGIFLTTPQTPPERVGLPKNDKADYIDFTLFDGTPVIEIEKEILIIPGRPDMPAWLKTLYFDYKATGRYDVHYLDIFKKVDARGGIDPTYMKINILSYRLNGKNYRK
jgi:hypothetical protein